MFCYQSPWQPFLTDQMSFNYFCRGSPRDHSSEVRLKLAQTCRSNCHLKQIDINPRKWTLQDRQMPTDPNSDFKHVS